MKEIESTQNLIDITEKMGYSIGDKMIANIELFYGKSFNFLPELAVFITSYLVKKSFTRQTTPPENITNSIRFFFHNVFENNAPSDKSSIKTQLPYVRIFPSSHMHQSHFKKTRKSIVLRFL